MTTKSISPALLFVLAALMACDGAGSPAERRGLLPIVEPPAIEQLDEPIRLQYEERRRALDAALATTASDAELAAAYGAVGMWGLAYDSPGTAEPALRNAERLAGNDAARWSYYLGRLHRERGEIDAGREAFQRVLDAQPGDVATLVWLAEIEQDAGQTAAARRSFEQALAADPACARALAGLGRIAAAEGDQARARELLEAALAAAPGVAEIHYALGLTYRALGELDRAEEHLRRGVAGGSGRQPIPLRDPLNDELLALDVGAESLAVRARMALEAGRFDDAVELFRRAVEAAPQKVTLRLNLGNALVRADRVAEAVDEYREALRLDPGQASAHYNLGVVLEDAGRLAEAQEHYRAALDADPQHARARARLEGLSGGRGTPAIE